jgi:aqualysin 1
VYSAALNGFAAELNAGQLNAMQRHPAVAYVEQDAVVTTAATQTNATWGLDRIDQRDLPLNGTYIYTPTGAGVRAYIIDTGYPYHAQRLRRAGATRLRPPSATEMEATATATARTWPAPWAAPSGASPRA